MLSTIIQTYEPNPWFNLALEELIANTLAEDEIALYVWQNVNTVVIGKNQNAWRECRCELLEAEGGRLARRSTGGGAVYHDRGNLNYTFIAKPRLYDAPKQFGVITGACAMDGVRAELSGRNDVLAEGRKISGNAFKSTRDYCLMHGTLLVDVDMAKLSRYLQPPAEKLRAKGVQSVRSRVANLSEINPEITVEGMRQNLSDAFEACYGKSRHKTLGDFDMDALDRLYARFSSWDWRYGETPRFDADLSTRFDWGGVEIALRLRGGRIEQAKMYSDAMDPDLPEKVEQALVNCEYGRRMGEKIAAIAAGNPQLLDVAKFLNDRA